MSERFWLDVKCMNDVILTKKECKNVLIILILFEINIRKYFKTGFENLI